MLTPTNRHIPRLNLIGVWMGWGIYGRVSLVPRCDLNASCFYIVQVNGCMQYSDKIPDGFYLIHGMDAYSWSISTDLQNAGLIPSFESLMSVEPCDDSSVVVVAIDKSRDPGLREIVGGLVSLRGNWINPKDVVDHLASLVCSRLG